MIFSAKSTATRTEPERSLLCTSCVRAREMMLASRRRVVCKCCGKDLTTSGRNKTTNVKDVSGGRAVTKESLLMYRKPTKKQPQILSRVQFRPALNVKATTTTATTTTTTRKPCLKKYIATVNTQAIEKYKGNSFFFR